MALKLSDLPLQTQKTLAEDWGKIRQPSKYRAKHQRINGYHFDSKKESRRYQELLLLRKSGVVMFFLRQPTFDLGGGVTYKADFLVFWTNGDVTIEDVKGFETKEFKTKKKLVEAKYHIKIDIL